MRFQTLSNESLIEIYLEAHKRKLDDSFLKMLLDEIKERNIYELLFETSSRT